MNLYNKIYEAIDNGIQKALIISDNQDNDTSIRWKEKEISNDFNLLNEYVKKFLTSNNYKEIYQEMSYLLNGDIKYKVHDFEELTELYKRLYFAQNPVVGGSHDNVNINWIDFSNTIILILDDYSEIPLDMFNKDIHKILLIKIKNNICGHDIIFHKDIKISKGIQWNETEVDEETFNKTECVKANGSSYWEAVRKNCDGYEHTYNNINIKDDDDDNYPAFKYCKYKSLLGYKGYLPAIGELMFMCENANTIRDIVYLHTNMRENISIMQLYRISQNQFWSSSEADYANAWYKAADGKVYTFDKVNDIECNEDENSIETDGHYTEYPMMVFPLYKKI